MAQIRNRYDINDLIEDERVTVTKTLPRFFNEKDGISKFLGINISIIIHLVFALLLLILNFVAGIVFPHLPKPELPNKDIEFTLVQNESKPPINKKTKLRSDRDSQAGGHHDPKKRISEPSPAPKKDVKQVAKQPEIQPSKKPQPSKAAPAPAPKQTQVVKQQPAVQKPAPAKPSAVKAPSAPKNIFKPSGVTKPSAPKISTAPKSPFNIPASPGNSGTSYKPAGTPQGGGGATTSKGSGTAAPAPKFSSSHGSGTGSSSGSSGGSKSGARGTGGYGNSGNPSPGNPNGAPGVDAIKQPNWGPYMRDLEARIKRNWSPPKQDTSKRVKVLFTIGRDGRLLSHKIIQSSGVPIQDRAAMSAIELTAPFRPLPPEFKGQSVPVEFTFDYNVINSVLK